MAPRLPLLALLLLVTGAPAATKTSGFTGTWLADLSSQTLPPYPDVYLVADGTYRCDSCVPPRTYPADGKPHPVPGDPEVTSESVTVSGPRSIVTRIEGPSMTRMTTMTVAPDGRTATYVSLDRRPGMNGELRTEYLARRVAPAPPGAHPVSGSWRGVRYVAVPDQLRTYRIELQGSRLSYSVPAGISYTAVLGGPYVPVRGPFGGKVTAAVRRLDASTLLETRMEDGKIVQERTYRLTSGGSLAMATTNKLTGATYRVLARRVAR
jgi:hypothetical protein